MAVSIGLAEPKMDEDDEDSVAVVDDGVAFGPDRGARLSLFRSSGAAGVLGPGECQSERLHTSPASFSYRTHFGHRRMGRQRRRARHQIGVYRQVYVVCFLWSTASRQLRSHQQ